MDSHGDEVPENDSAAATGSVSTPRKRPTWRSGITSPNDSARDRAIEKIMNDFQTQAASLENDRKDLQQSLQKSNSEFARVQRENLEMKQELMKKDSEAADAKREAQSKINEALMIKEQSKSEQERMNRMTAEADALREEISQLKQNNTELKGKMAEIETQSSLDGSEVVPLRYQVQRLTTEMNTVTAHSNWLDSELQARNDQLKSVRAAQASEVAQLRADLDQAINEKESSYADIDMLRKQNDQLQSKVEQISRELMHVKQESADAKLNNEKELVAERRLISLQKDQLERVQQRYETISKQFESQKTLALEAEEDSRRESDDRATVLESEMRQVLEDQAAEFQEQIKVLKEQLVESNRRREEAEDGLLSTTPSKPRRGHLAIRDGAAENDANNDGPINLTDLYTRLSETEDELREEQNKRKRAEIRMSRVEAEIQAKAPILVRQRKEYELALEREEDARTRLQSALSESRASRAESSEAQMELGRLQAGMKDLEEENVVLAKQVQALLASKSGQDMSDATDIPTSVQEIQNQNQRLLGEHRRLSATVKDLESKIKSASLQKKLSKAENELKILREDRQQQEAIVDKIVQQRDLYRSLLRQNDDKMIQNESEEVSALEIVQKQSNRAKQLEQQNNELNTVVVTLRSEINAAVQEKELSAERLARYEAHTTELTISVDRLRIELSSAQANSARCEAGASFNREKVSRLEESLQRSRDEVSRLNISKNELQQVTAGLQNALSSANAESNRCENELRQAEQKLRMAETRAEVARAAEKRLADEAIQLRTEVAKQGVLLEHVERIEAGLSAKNSSERESLREEISKLTDRLSSIESKHSLEVQRLEGRLKDQGVQMDELALREKEAKSDSDAAKAALAAASSEMETVLKKNSILESKLRSAKKRLGENDGDRDFEAELQEKVDDLTQSLESAQSESATAKERVATYQKLAKESADALSEANSALEKLKLSHAGEMDQVKIQMDAIRTESASRQEMIKELTADLSSHRGEKDKAVAELNNQILKLKAECDNCQKDAEVAVSRTASLESELATLRVELTLSQNNYERELSLHSTARSSLRAAREEAEAAGRAKIAAEEQNSSLRNELNERKELWEQEKISLGKSIESTQLSLTDLQAQNSVLHSQLETLSQQAEKSTALVETGESAGDMDTSTLQKIVSELREVVRFLRSEKEVLQGNLDLARRAAERGNAASNILKRSLDEARAEIKILQDAASSSKNINSETSETKLAEQVAAAEEKSRLLSDSNNLLREEIDKIKKSTELLQSELDTTKKSIEPLEASCQSLEVEKTALLAEKESLGREVGDWKGRVQSLVSKFNQIDPEEHAQALKKVRDLTSEVFTLKSNLEESIKENKRIRSLAQRVKSELNQNKNFVEAHKKTIAKLTTEKEALSTKKDDATKKELEEVKEQLSKAESQKASDKLQIDGANERNKNLLNMLRQLKSQNADLKKKSALLSNEAKEAKAALEKQLSASKAVAADTSPANGATETGNTGVEPPVAATDSSGANPPSGGEDLPKDTSATQPAITKISTETPTTKPRAIPKVPSGGFKFGPSDSATVAASDPNQANIASSTTSNKKRPSSELQQAPTSATVASTPAPKKSSTSPKSSPPGASNAEMSIKEKLLEKKRKALMDLKKAKEMKVSKVDPVDPEPATKRTKTESSGVDGNISGVAATESAETVSNAAKPLSPIPASSSPVLPESDGLGSKGTVSGEGAPLLAPAPSPAPFSAAPAPPTAIFGMTSTPAFGSGSMLNATAPSFGSISGSGLSGFPKTTLVSSPLKMGIAPSKAGSGAFLDMKPPGTSTSPPQFTFGTSGSITLPTPAQKSPPNAMFNAFASPSPFNSGGSGVTAKPLFGVKPNDKPSENKGVDASQDDEDEDGEINDA